MLNETSWVKAITFSVISAILTLVIFLMYQVFMADILLLIITTEYESGLYMASNLILFAGLLLILVISLFVNFLFMRNYTIKTRIISNIFISILTLFILLLYAWISIILVYNEQYQTLSIEEQLRLLPYFYIILSAYILPSPVLFWIIGLIIYHVILVFFIKFFYIEKKPVSVISTKKKKKNKIDKNKYSML